MEPCCHNCGYVEDAYTIMVGEDEQDPDEQDPVEEVFYICDECGEECTLEDVDEDGNVLWEE